MAAGSATNFRAATKPREHDTMNTVTVYACPSVPMDSIECTIEYDPAVVEAFLHPPNSGQERADDGSFGDEKVL